MLSHFNRTLAFRAHKVAYESLIRLGILGLGERETLRYSPHQRAFQPLADTERFYRRVR